MTFDIAKLPGVRAQFERGTTEAGAGQARGPANAVGAASPAAVIANPMNLPHDLKTMAFQGGRYYVVSEKK
ncbi:MAG: hypothetical protein RR983_02545 [Massilia sp.]|uniref:hypothetical protein n=1 Tax=Massilia sp. TaxID=1882437 RepID=UPI002FCA7F31